jgi:3-oxoacyl-[acyl-carrier-protein] synthase-3
MTPSAFIGAIRYHLPETVLSNTTLAEAFPEWPAARIEEKTGIAERRIAGANECASDLACKAAQKLFAEAAVDPGDIDYVLFCTQSPDYLLPTTACIIQRRLGLRDTAGATDINLGCSGYVYGLGLAKGLIETGQATNVLFLTGDTYSKYLDPKDQSVRTLFGDAGAATLVKAAPARTGPDESSIGPFVYGTDGNGANSLILRAGGSRGPGDNRAAGQFLVMKGPDIFSFTLRVVPECIKRLLAKSDLTFDDVDLFVFHQANRFMLEQLRSKLGIPADRFLMSMSHCGNTVSSTIPIALHDAVSSGRLVGGERVMLVGFGVGLSWGAAMVRWPRSN